MPIYLSSDREHRKLYENPCTFAAAFNATYDAICRELNGGQLIGDCHVVLSQQAVKLASVEVRPDGIVNFGDYDTQGGPLFDRLRGIAAVHGFVTMHFG